MTRGSCLAKVELLLFNPNLIDITQGPRANPSQLTAVAPSLVQCTPQGHAEGGGRGLTRGLRARASNDTTRPNRARDGRGAGDGGSQLVILNS